MSGSSVYRVVELIGSSSESWEAAAQNAVRRAGRFLGETLRGGFGEKIARSE